MKRRAGQKGVAPPFNPGKKPAGRLAGDNGLPGFPRGKCNLYDAGVASPLILRWPGKINPGRRVADFVNLMDLAPTFLEAAGIEPPATMDGRSLMPQLLAGRSGQIDPSRDHVIVGRERHVPYSQIGNLPYPSRAIRTSEFLYIRNFKPDRWPMGVPYELDAAYPARRVPDGRKMPPFGDWDNSPTKQWYLDRYSDARWASFVQLAVGKRPAEELYDLRKDSDQTKNVASDPAYAEAGKALAARLLNIMQETDDPRLNDAFDRPPYVEQDTGAAADGGAGR